LLHSGAEEELSRILLAAASTLLYRALTAEYTYGGESITDPATPRTEGLEA
jgi:hypothetical protein